MSGTFATAGAPRGTASRNLHYHAMVAERPGEFARLITHFLVRRQPAAGRKAPHRRGSTSTASRQPPYLGFHPSPPGAAKLSQGPGDRAAQDPDTRATSVPPGQQEPADLHGDESPSGQGGAEAPVRMRPACEQHGDRGER